MSTVREAVILAAGIGARMKDKAENRPKGFISIDGRSLIVRSIENLLEVGIRRIVIGTGFRSELFEDLRKTYPQIDCIRNDLYRETGSAYTLYNSRVMIHDDFLLLESDLLYEKDALRIILEDPRRDLILSSDMTYSGDEVYIEADSSDRLCNMSKKEEDLGTIHSELVGISKLSKDTFAALCRIYEKDFVNVSGVDYESLLVETSRRHGVFVQRVEGLTWCEIDNEHHFERAINRIFPRIKFKDERRTQNDKQVSRKDFSINEKLTREGT
jgi:2-aminoethylphosphonate-pyruvate transaminase